MPNETGNFLFQSVVIASEAPLPSEAECTTTKSETSFRLAATIIL